MWQSEGRHELQGRKHGKVNKKLFQDWMTKLIANQSHASDNHYTSLGKKKIEVPNRTSFSFY